MVRNHTLHTNIIEKVTNLVTPDKNAISGKTSFPVVGSTYGRTSKTARIQANVSQMVFSAKKRPGQILSGW